MAFLRRGLVTNRGAVPSVHTRLLNTMTTEEPAAAASDAQPVFAIKKVAKVLKLAEGNGYHQVELICGHHANSKSTFQGYCRQCKH